MNCKPGDLAIVLRANETPEHVGKILTVVRLHNGDWPEPHWLTEPEFLHSCGNPLVFADSDLRPLRPDEGEDEILRIAGHPEYAYG